MSLINDASLVLTPNSVKEGKLYSIIPSNGNGDMTVVRATTATRVNSSGLIESVAANVPRLNYDSVGGCPSILVEPQRTNLVTYSEQISNTIWLTTNSATITADADTSPEGTMDADRLTAGASLSQVQNTATVVSGSVYTVSIWIKRITGTGQVYLRSIENVNTPITITNNWVRYSLTTTATSTIGRIGVALQTSGDVVSIWGAQLELGAYLTSYIPTVATSVTRNADVISKTGISSLIGQTEGTLFAEFALNTSVNFQMDVRITAGTGNEIIIFNTGLRPTVNITSANVLIFSTGNALDNTSLGANNKIAVAYKNNDFAIYQNGVLKFSQSTGNVPLSLPDLLLSNGSRSYLLKNTMLFKTRLTNTELAQLTTL